MAHKRTTAPRRRSTLSAEAHALASGKGNPAAPRAAVPGQLRRKVAPGGTERVAVWLTTDVVTRLRIHAAKTRTSLSVLADRAIAAYLENAGR